MRHIVLRTLYTKFCRFWDIHIYIYLYISLSPEEHLICKAFFGLPVTHLSFISIESLIFFNFGMLVKIGNSISYFFIR